MATFKIPNSQGQARQLGTDDTTGEIWSTFNMDMLRGKMRLARPLQKVTNDAALSSDTVEGFAMLNGTAYAITDDNFYKASGTYSSWSIDSEGTRPDLGRDITVFDSALIFNTDNGADLGWTKPGVSAGSGWWSDDSQTTALTSGLTHMLNVIKIGGERLTVTDGNQLHFYILTSGTIADAGDQTSQVGVVDALATHTITCCKAGYSTAWVGTYTEDDDEGIVYSWDGRSAEFTTAYKIGAKACLSMEIVNNVPYIVTETGEIKAFSGSSFQTVGKFPFADKILFADGVETGLIQVENRSRPVHPKGMKLIGDILYIFANWEDSANSGNPIDEQTPSGLWAFDINTRSLTHVASPNNSHIHGSSPLMTINDPATRFFIGGRTDLGYSDTRGIWIENLDAANYGYIVTNEIQSDSVSDVYKELVVKALHNATSEILVKYRTSNDALMPVIVNNAAWAATNTFNTTADLSGAQVGYEVEVINGSGAGRLAHIVSIEQSALTYSIIIDENIGTEGEDCDIRVDNWSKIPVTFTQADGEIKRFGAEGNSAWGQFKIELRGSNGYPEIRQLMVNTNNKNTT